MILQDKYDRIIALVEEFVEFGEPDIPEAVSKETGLNLRLLGDAFQFITDMTIIQYIRKRKLVFALSAKLERELPIEQVVAQSGFSDAAAFSKACKKVFNLSPSQITQEVIDQHPPLTFARLTYGKDVGFMENDTMITEKKKETICGITAKQFAEVKQVLEIGALYGLTDEEAEFVYRLSQTSKITNAQAADFFEDFKLQVENGTYYIARNLFEMAELSCKYNLSFSETQTIMEQLEYAGYWSIHELPEFFFDIYFCEENNRRGWDVEYIREMAEAMKANNLPFSKLDDAILYAYTFGIDIVEAIENFEEYEKEYNDIGELPFR